MIDHALIWHKGSSTMKTAGKPMARYFDARNLLYVLRRHQRRQRAWPQLVRLRWQTYARYVYYRFCLELEVGYRAAAHGVLEGVADGLTGRMGPVRQASSIACPVRSDCIRAASHEARPRGGKERRAMRLLFVKHTLAWPRVSGHDVHAFHMMQACAARGHEVVLATAVEPAPEAIRDLGLARTCGSAVRDGQTGTDMRRWRCRSSRSGFARIGAFPRIWLRPCVSSRTLSTPTP